MPLGPISEPFRLYYVTISVPDAPAAAKWYEDILGYHLVRSKDFPEFSTRIRVVERDGFRMELLEQGDSIDQPVARPEPPAHSYLRGISQFALLTEDLETTIQQLAERGVEIVWERRIDTDLGLSFQFIKDLNGNLIQFVELMK